MFKSAPMRTQLHLVDAVARTLDPPGRGDQLVCDAGELPLESPRPARGRSVACAPHSVPDTRGGERPV